MLCEHCKKNEADLNLHINVNGQEGEVHLCQECAMKLAQSYSFMPGMPFGGMLQNFGAMQSAPSPFAEPLQTKGREEPAEPAKPGELQHKRRINALKAGLQAAVAQENYEEAAKIRDEIKSAEKEACRYGL